MMLFINRIYYPTYCRLDGLIVGVSLAMIREFNTPIWSRLTNFSRLIFGVGMLLVVCGTAIMPGVNPSLAAAIGAFPLVSLGFGAITIAALSPTFWLSRYRLPMASVLATLAYTLYLVHKQMIALAERLINEPEMHPISVLAVAGVLTGIASLSLHLLIERPFVRLRRFSFSNTQNTLCNEKRIED